MLKKIAIIFLFISGLISPSKNFASHLAGGYINYTYLSPNHYRVRVRISRDCNGIGIGTSVLLCYRSVSCNYSNTINLNLDSSSFRQINPCLSPATSTCVGGFSYGIGEFDFSGILVLPNSCDDWRLSLINCCRNVNADNVDIFVGTGYYLYATIDNLNFPVNSSPEFTQSVYASYCINSLTPIPFSCTDADGDSIVYEIVHTPTSDSMCSNNVSNINFLPPYSITTPYASASPIFIDQATGILYSTPNQIQYVVLDVKISEYRNGILMDSLIRDESFAFTFNVTNADIIAGKVFFDENNNGVFDSLDSPLKNKIVKTSPYALFSATDNAGNYLLKVPPDTFNVAVQNLDTTFLNPDFHTVNFSGLNQTSFNNDFAYYINPSTIEVGVEILASPVAHSNKYDHISLYCANNGGVVQNVSVKLILDTSQTFLSSNPPPDSVNGDTINWILGTFLPLDYEIVSVTTLVDSNISLGSNLYMSASILPLTGDSIPANNFDEATQRITIPVDPNIKDVQPAGDIYPQFISNGNYLNYTIYFQNTGVGPATDVLVYDMLDADLDINTLDFISSSHNCFMDLSMLAYYHTIAFKFLNINLPCASQNFGASQGFIKYRIKPLLSTPVGAAISNSANIFFDFNAPVHTNTVVTNVVSPVAIQYNVNTNYEIKVFPNPLTSTFNIACDNVKNGQTNISVMNVLGKRVIQKSVSVGNNKLALELSLLNYPQGIYFLLIENSDTILTSRLIKQ